MDDLTNWKIETVRADGEFKVGRAEHPDGVTSFLVISPVPEQPAPATLAKLEHAFALRSELDSSWAARPLDLMKWRGLPALVIEDPAGRFVDELIVEPLAVADFLRLAIGIAVSLGGLHARGLVHKDVKPANLIANIKTGQAWLTGFGLATRLPRHRQPAEPPEIIAGTLAYMAPEQTGRMNRSIDSRTDLYSLGVTFYEMCVGALPFTAHDPMEWVHCHIARLPEAPSLRRSDIPKALSGIILKLLAKNAEERYQTAAGVEADLRRCLLEWQSQGHIDPFTLGEHDGSNRLLIPEKLYGRTREVDSLLAAFDRVVAVGTPELVLVSGYSGVGKSSLVNELHKWLVPPRGLFASGKFDQYKRDIPFVTLAQAFQSLVRPLLSKSEAELRSWRDALYEALNPNGQLIVDLVPELQYIIGNQPPVPELPPQAAQGRLQLVFRRFLGVFARPEHPLALFLDDLQWLDAATLDLIESLLLQTDAKHLLLIGAYRDNEVSATHPLMRRLEAIRRAGSKVHDIVLSPLSRQDVGEFLADLLHSDTERAAPLAQLVHQKTSGNPFFAIQFMSALADQALLTFDLDAARWVWDLDAIHAQGYTDNVVDLMILKLNLLPIETRNALQRLACLGNSVSFEMLRMVYQDALDEIHEHLWEAVSAGLIFHAERSYRFLHDRVQEAAYALIPGERRAQEHFRVGILLGENTPPEDLEDNIFEIVNQLNRGLHLLTSPTQRAWAANLNLLAGRRAKGSTAYTSALIYLRAGRSVTTESIWEHNYELIFSIESLIAECELLTADMPAAQERLAMLAQRATTPHHRAITTRLQLTLYTTLDQSESAIEVFLKYLSSMGTNWPKRPTLDVVMGEYEQIWSRVGGRQIEDLVDLPLVSNQDVLDMLDVFTEIVHPALFYDENLSSLVVCRMVNLSLEHGNCDGSCFGYVWFAMFAGPRFNNYRDGFRFGQLGFDLVEKRQLSRYQARTYITFGTLLPWAKPAVDGRELVRRASDVAYRIGDLTFSAYSWHELITNRLMVGDELSQVQRDAETGLAFCRKAGFGLVAENCAAQLGVIRMLRGETATFGCFDAGDYNEAATEHRLASNSVLALAEFFYWTRKLQGRFFSGDYESAIDASMKAHRLLWTAPSQLETADFRFYSALAHAASWNSASESKKHRHRDALIDHHKQLQIWAEHCPENFEHRAGLAAAELARIDGALLAAEQLYEQAIRSAHGNGFIHGEAIANEVAGRFYTARSLQTVSDAYLRNARYCYLRWGALGKVRQLDQLYPHLAAPEGRHPVSTDGTIGTPVVELDAETVARASQALSSEIVLPNLIERLMQIAVEHAGAGRGLLILLHASTPLIEAEATTGQGRVDVHVRRREITASDLPRSVLHFVMRTRERVVLDDASAGNSYSDDEYFQRGKVKSVLCLPIVKQTKLIGVLYLENSLAPHVFTSSRLAVLDMLAAQAAISLENAGLYAALEQENLERKRAEEELRRSEAYLAEAQKLSCTGSFGWNVATDEHFWSDETYRIFEYGVSSNVSTEMIRSRIHPEDRPLLDGVLTRAANGDAFDYECRLLLPAGAVKQVHIVAHVVRGESGAREYVGAVMDITATRRAEAALRQAQAELAHVTRVTTMGELAASIAHEVNQPIAGVVINANACLRWLSRIDDNSVNLKEARETIQRIIRDGNRAGEIVARIRSLFKKTDLKIQPLDLNDTIREIIMLARSEMDKRGVTLLLELASSLPRVGGDRVQLQQVMLNLILNAIDAMAAVEDRARNLVIRTQSVEAREVMVTVRDTGIGLSRQSIERIFEAFHTTKASGLGMGLPISRSIVENHSGRLWVAEHEGPGASFCFTVPSHLAEDAPHPKR